MNRHRTLPQNPRNYISAPHWLDLKIKQCFFCVADIALDEACSDTDSRRSMGGDTLRVLCDPWMGAVIDGFCELPQRVEFE